MIFADFHEICSDFLRFSRKTLQLLKISWFQFNFSMIIPEIHLIFYLIFDLILYNFIFNFHIGTTPVRSILVAAVSLPAGVSLALESCDPGRNENCAWWPMTGRRVKSEHTYLPSLAKLISKIFASFVHNSKDLKKSEIILVRVRCARFSSAKFRKIQ